MSEWTRTGEFLFRDGNEVHHFSDWRVAELAALAFKLDAERKEVDAENALLRAVVDAARHMPRTTPKPGGASTLHDYKIEAAHAWGLDRALKALDSHQQSTPQEK